MNDFSELNERAAKLTRQIGLIRTGLGIDEINKKAEAIEREIGELRHDNNRLTRENEELKDSLRSLISSVENVRLSELPDSFQGVGKKLGAILETGRASDVPAEAGTTARIGVVADIVAMPKEGRAAASAAKEPDKPEIPSGLRRGPG
jgi:FtsZ-binding cell division protein ZapB